MIPSPSAMARTSEPTPDTVQVTVWAHGVQIHVFLRVDDAVTFRGELDDAIRGARTRYIAGMTP